MDAAGGDTCGYHDDKEGREANLDRLGRVQKRSASWEEDEVEEQPSAKRRKPGENFLNSKEEDSPLPTGYSHVIHLPCYDPSHNVHVHVQLQLRYNVHYIACMSPC